jgi:hypothetical protein
MAENNIDAIVPDIFEALDVVSRELTGMIPSVTMSSSAARARLNQEILVDISPTITGVDITPAMVAPDPTGLTDTGTPIIITKERAFPFGFNGNDQMGLNTGPGYMNSRAGKIAQAIRGLTNEVEVDLAALQSTFSRAYGTPTTTPFGTANDYTDASNVLKILKDNGAPGSDNQLVLNTTAGANFIGKQSAVNAAGTDSMLRQGVLLDLQGMPLRESAQVVTQTKGTGTSYTSATTGFAIGTTSIPIITGSGTVLAGDTVTFAGDTNKYVVTTGVAAPGTIVLAAPGLRVALAASAVAMTIGATSARNMCFNRSALVLAARLPARPEEGDLAVDVMTITDPRSGLSLEFSMYKGYRKVRYEVALAWGVKNIKPEHTALLLG